MLEPVEKEHQDQNILTQNQKVFRHFFIFQSFCTFFVYTEDYFFNYKSQTGQPGLKPKTRPQKHCSSPEL